MTAQEDVQRLLERLSPDQQALAKSVTMMRVENRTLRQQVKDLRESYDDLWKTLIVILANFPDKTMRIHRTQFLKFKEEYRIDIKNVDEEVVYRLLAVTDDIEP